MTLPLTTGEFSNGGFGEITSGDYTLALLTITLFIVNLRRTAERAGRAAERLEILERNNAIHRQMLDAAARRPRSRDDLIDRLRRGEF